MKSYGNLTLDQPSQHKCMFLTPHRLVAQQGLRGPSESPGEGAEAEQQDTLEQPHVCRTPWPHGSLNCHPSPYRRAAEHTMPPASCLLRLQDGRDPRHEETFHLCLGIAVSCLAGGHMPPRESYVFPGPQRQAARVGLLRTVPILEVTSYAPSS